MTTAVNTNTGDPALLAGAPRRDLLARVSDPTSVVMIALLLAAFVLLFHSFFSAQHRHSYGNGDWSHAYLVPLISVYLLWQNKSGLEKVRMSTFWPGLIPMLSGISCYLFFLVGSASNHLGQGLSVVLTLFGLVLLLLGPRVMRYAFLPIGYLVFAITLPEQIMNKVTWPLQQIAAKGAFVLLQMLGVTVDLTGNVLEVTDSAGVTHPLNVAEACSGMRMLIGFLALGAAVGLVASREWWKRIVLIALGLPLAVLLNVLRVAVLGIAALFDMRLAAGQAHTFIGTVLLVPGFGIYMLIVWALNKAVPETAGTKGATG